LTETTYLDNNSDTAYDTGALLASTTASNRTVNSTQTLTTAAMVSSTLYMACVYSLFLRSDGVSTVGGSNLRGANVYPDETSRTARAVARNA
jgi:hypothetical protein